MALGFQTSVGVQMAPAVEGDWATANPRHTYLAGPGGLIAGDSGLYVGRFAWVSMSQVDANSAPAVANNFGSGPPHGFVNRQVNIAAITTFRSQSSMLILPYREVTLHNYGDIWMRNSGSTMAQYGQKAYADVATGLASFAATGTAGTGSATGGIVAGTGSATGTITGNVLAITGAPTGQFYPGSTLSGSAVAVGTKIVYQLTSTETGGALGGRGTYSVSIPEQTVASTTISATHGILTLSAGSVVIGDGFTGAGVTAGSVVTAAGVGANLGKFIVDPTQTVTAGVVMTTGLTVETPYYACSSGLAGELVKISRISPLGL